MTEPKEVRGLRNFLPLFVLPQVILLALKLWGPISPGTNHVAEWHWLVVTTPAFAAAAAVSLGAWASVIWGIRWKL